MTVTTDDPKDGFDFIEYPCAYSFKAMCKTDTGSQQTAQNVMHDIVLEHIDKSCLIETQIKESRTGKFTSVTLSVRLHSRDELEEIYRAIAASPLVVMTL